MLLNSKYSNFLIKLPNDFVTDKIKENYTKFVQKLPYPFEDVLSFLNWSIQSMSWPELQTQTTEQGTRNDVTTYTGAWEPFQYTNREFDITFKTTESFLNYFICHEILIDYWGEDDKSKHKVFMPDIQLHLLDNNGFILVTYLFKDVVLAGISGLELSSSMNVPEFKTFNLNFKFRRFEIAKYYD